MISIIIPIYNMADSLEKCINSILNQRFTDYELILIDDGSKDESYDICKKYAINYSNITAIHQDNQGSGPARNAGIRIANGDYLLFIDSDDELAGDALFYLNQRIIESNSDLYVFGYKVIDAAGRKKTKCYTNYDISGEEVRKDYSPFFMNLFDFGIQGAPWNKLFKTEIVRKYNILYPNLKRHQDEVFISRYVSYTSNVRFCNDILYTHFANDIKKVWNKYPSNYFDIVKSLYQYRKDIIIPWNPSNSKVESLIYSEYINNAIRACFRQFDKELVPSYSVRKEWYTNILFKEFEVRKLNYPKELLGDFKVLQNKMFIFAIKHQSAFLLDLIVKVRIKAIN